MNILFVTGIFPPNIGGPATYTDRMGHEMTSRGHGVRVITLSDDTEIESDTERPFDVRRIRRGQNKLVRAARTIEAIRASDSWADIIYVQGLMAEAAAAKTLTETPMIARVVGDKAWEASYQRGWVSVPFDEFQTGQFGLRVEALRKIRSWSVRRMDAVVAATDYFAEQIAGWGVPETRIRRIDNFIGASTERPVEVDLPGGHDRCIVTVGRLVEWKRIDILIDAVAEIPNTDLVVVGDGPERERWERHAERVGVADRVHFVGKRPHAETLGFIQAADVFALPSTWESFSIVVLEAMMVGTPVVASDIGGPNEIVEHGHDGILVEPESSGSLAAEIQRILDDPETAAEMVAEARSKVQDYRLETIADEVEIALQEMHS